MQTSRTLLAQTLLRPWLWFWIGASLLLIQISPWWWTPNIDAMAYLSIARNLAHGRLAALGRAQLYYAPGYPILISPLFLLGNRPFLAIAILQWLLALALMVGVYRWVRRLKPEAALPVTMLVMVNVSLWEYFRQTLSDFSFTVLLIWAALFLDEAVSASGRARIKWIILGGMLAVFTAVTRQTGSALVAGFAMALLVAVVRRRWTWFSALLAVITVGVLVTVPVLTTILYDHSQALPGVKTYTDNIRDPNLSLAAQLLEGLRLRIYEVGRLVIPGMFGAYSHQHRWMDFNTLIYVPVFIALAWAWWRRFRRQGADVLNCAWIVYLFFYLVWPFDQSTRFMMPMLPVLCLLIWELAACAGRYRDRILATLIFAHLAVALGVWVSVLPQIRRENRETWATMSALSEPIRADPQPVAVYRPHRQQYYVEFLLDWRVATVDSPASIPASTHWLLMPTGYPIPEGFALRQSAGSYRLLERIPTSRSFSSTAATPANP